MRSFLLIASAILAFAATMTFETTDANAVVCARGVYRAGCAGARGAVVVRRPPVVAACRRVLVNGVCGYAAASRALQRAPLGSNYDPMASWFETRGVAALLTMRV
jgi:hypothetical protein